MAVPAAAPSTLTWTLPMAVPTAVALSIAQPATATVPDIAEPGAGASMCTVGGTLETVTVTVADPVSGAASVSVAETVMVCEPELNAAVSNWYENPTLGQP